MNGQLPQNAPQQQPTPEQAQELVTRLLVDLDAAGSAIVERYLALGYDKAGIAWCLTQACLSVAVASYFHAGRSPEDLISEVHQGWRANMEQAQKVAAQSGRA